MSGVVYFGEETAGTRATALTIYPGFEPRLRVM
jgi:hypothetical protein